MTSLTIRQRAKVNAALLCLHSTGHNANAVSAAAKALIASGQPAPRAFEKALNDALAGNPDLLHRVDRALAQIEASDNGTVEQYDRALCQYIQTGDASALSPVIPMATRDAVTLAVRNGELRKEDVDAGNIDWEALGMEPDSAQVAYEAPAPAAPAPTPVQSQFAFGQPPSQPQGQHEAPAQSATFIRTATGGIRSVPTGERALREQGVAPDRPFVRTTTGGFRGVMTGERAARWQGTPMLTPEAPQSEV